MGARHTGSVEVRGSNPLCSTKKQCTPFGVCCFLLSRDSNPRGSAHKENGSVNRFLAQSGVLFSFATARSRYTALKVTKGIECRLPIITYNGVFTVEYESGRTLFSNLFGGGDCLEILSALWGAGISPIVYSVQNGRERFSYVLKELSPAGAEFVKSRNNDSRDNPVADRGELANGSIFYFTCIDSAGKLRPLYERFKDRFRCVYSKDIYTGEQWLEIMPGGATKANAALKLKEMLGCEKLVAFGDSENDMDLFAAADECYAVANAVPEIKERATAVIGANNEDAVAKFLLQQCTE